MRLKLFPKIAIVLISLATVPALVVGWQTATLNREHLESNILELHTNLANALADRIDLSLDGLAGKMRAFVETLRLEGIRSLEPFQSFLNSHSEFVSLSFLDARGRERFKAAQGLGANAGKLEDHASDPVYASYRDGRVASAAIEPKFGFFVRAGDPQFVVIYPYDPRDFSAGAIRIVVSLASLWKEVEREGAGVGGGGRQAFLVDREGNRIAHTDPAAMAAILAGRPDPVKDHPVVREALQNASIGSKEFRDETGRSWIGSYALASWTGWVVVIQQPKDAAYIAVAQTRRRAFHIVLVSLLAAAAAAFLFAKNISRPVFLLIESAQRVARGDFHHRVSLDSKDEIGDLAQTFNTMIRELERYEAIQVDKLMEEKTKTESVIFSIADGIILTDAEGRIQLLNDQSIQILGLKDPAGGAGGQRRVSAPPRAYAGKPLLELLANEQVRRPLEQLLAEPESGAVREVILGETGAERHFQLTCRTVYTPGLKKKAGLVTVVHDITIERQVEAMKESFIHSITHDLRNPMTSIQGFIKFMLDEQGGPVNDKQKGMLLTMERASARLLNMINDILDVAKIEAGKIELVPGPVAFHALIADVVSLYVPLAQRKSIRMQAVVPAGGAVIVADGEMMERVLGNLVANALKFTTSGGEVTLQLEVFEDRVQVAVRDNGPGIPEALKEKIFDRFQQVDATKKGGTGLGLTICKYFVELHGGEIWVESGPGQGSAFIFWVPRSIALPKAGAARQQ